ncbi:MAG TPA: DUF2341 domain-containing protein, partial [Cytophagaceae bacterium]
MRVRKFLLYILLLFVLLPKSIFAQGTKKEDTDDYAVPVADTENGYHHKQPHSLLLNASVPLGEDDPQITGTKTDAKCYGSSDGKIEYTISGLTPPLNYTWSNGVSGTVYGSCYTLIKIDNPSEAHTDYQVQVTIPYYAGTTMRSDFANIRFTDSAGVQPYSYWFEESTASSARFWVKVPSIPVGTSYMRVSYCNPSDLSLSDGYATFDFFDDFEDGNASGWTYQCQNNTEAGDVCSASVTTDENYNFEPGYSLKLYGYGACSGTENYLETIVIRQITLPVREFVHDVSFRQRICNHTTCPEGLRTYVYGYYNGNLQYGYYLERPSSTCGCSVSVRWFNAYGESFYGTGSAAPLRIRSRIPNCGREGAYIDNVRIRKYSSSSDPVITVNPPQTLVLDNLAAGSYTITVTDGSSNTSQSTFEIEQPANVSGTGASGCSNTSVTLSVSGSYSSYKWYTESTGGTGTTGATFTTPVLATTTNFYVSGVGSNGCETSPRTAVTATIHARPSAPSASNASRCGPGTVILSAGGSPSGYRWYDAATDGTFLGAGATYTTPWLSSTTTYYVAAVSSANCQSATRTSVSAVINTIPSAPTAS